MQSKRAKMPPLSIKTKILCFDLETNGLHGEAFAAGAVVMDGEGKVYSEFSGRAKINGEVDEWVAKNVIPNIADMPEAYTSYKQLREAFWKWYVPAEADSDYVLVSNGYPVEYRFLLACQEDNIEERYWQHPFPILDLSSLLIQIGEESLSKSKLLAKIIREGDYSRHHPVHDAKITTIAAFEAFKTAGRI